MNHAVALLDALLLEHIGELVYFVVQFDIGIGAGFINGLALPHESCLVLAGRLDVTVKTVVGYVQLAALEPGDICFRKIGLNNLVPLLEKLDVLICHLGPERIRTFNGLFVHCLILSHALDMGLLSQFLGNVKNFSQLCK